MASPAGRSASGRTPLKSPVGRTRMNDDAAEKEHAAAVRAANELRRRCAPPGPPPAVCASRRTWHACIELARRLSRPAERV